MEVASYIFRNPIEGKLEIKGSEYEFSGGEYFERAGAKAAVLRPDGTALEPGAESND